MRRSAAALVACALLTLATLRGSAQSTPLPSPDQSNAAQTGLSLITSTSKSSYADGDDIELVVIIRNTGTSPVMLGGSAFEVSSMRFVVTDPTSKPAALTPYGKQQLAIPPRVHTNVALHLKAGYQRKYVFHLAKMFDLSKAGMYMVTVKRTVFMPGKSVEGASTSSPMVAVALASDPLAINITASVPTPPPPAITATAAPTASTSHGASRWTIAFVRDSDIWVAGPDGNDQKLIIRDGEAPCWSPDKALIAFARNGNVWVSDYDGDNQRQLTDTESLEAGVNPVFSPDGKWIAYRDYTSRGDIQIREVSLDGKDNKVLVDDGEQPAW